MNNEELLIQAEINGYKIRIIKGDKIITTRPWWMRSNSSKDSYNYYIQISIHNGDFHSFRKFKNTKLRTTHMKVFNQILKSIKEGVKFQEDNSAFRPIYEIEIE